MAPLECGSSIASGGHFIAWGHSISCGGHFIAWGHSISSGGHFIAWGHSISSGCNKTEIASISEFKSLTLFYTCTLYICIISQAMCIITDSCKV